MAFQKLPLELRLAIWEETLDGEGRLVGARPEVDFTALRPGLPVVAHINQESRNFFHSRYIRIRDMAFHRKGFKGPRFPIDDHVYVNGEIDTLTMGETANGALGLDEEQRATLRTIWLVDWEICIISGFGDYDDIVAQERDQPVARLPSLIFQNLTKIYVTTYRIEYSVKEWDDCYGFYILYHVATGNVFMQEGYDFDDAMWLNKRCPDAETKFTEEGFHVEIEIDRSPTLRFTDGEAAAWYLVTKTDGNEDAQTTASLQSDGAADSPEDANDNVHSNDDADDGYSTDRSAGADTDEESEWDPHEHVDEASVHWRMVWQMVARFLEIRLG